MSANKITKQLLLIGAMAFALNHTGWSQSVVTSKVAGSNNYSATDYRLMSDYLDSLRSQMMVVRDSVHDLGVVQAYQQISLSSASLQISGQSLMDSLRVMNGSALDGNVVVGGDLSVLGTTTGITGSMVGLGNVDNTSDADKPVSTATQTALDLKAPLASPTFTGTPSLPTGTTAVTQSASDNSTKLATTAYVDAAVSGAGSATTEMLQEVTVASDNATTFTLSQTPAATSVVRMYRNGILLSGTAMTVSGTDVTYVPANNGGANLVTGDRIQFFYAY